MSTASSHSLPRRALRLLFWMLSLLLAFAAVLAVVAWRKSSTPLEARSFATDAQVDLEAFRRGELHFPEESWAQVDPALLGWDVDTLERAREAASALDTSSMIVLHRGVPIALWGDVAQRENSQSIRKALVGSLFGLLVAERRLDLDTTLGELGIDDDPPLTATEKTATVRHLLLARSGVYHPALYEARGWKQRKPERGSAAPGEEWFYNNWGFNALSTVYETVADLDFGAAFAEEIAGPLDMEDFRPQDVVYVDRDHPAERMQGHESDHPAYIFMISARDLARYGLLYLAEGRWGDRRILPAEWVNESTVEGARPTGWGERRWGYLWWVFPPSEHFAFTRIVASGGRGHKLTLIPELDLVVVHRIPTGGSGIAAQLFRRFVWHPSVEDRDHDAVLAQILAAHPNLPAATPRTAPAAAEGGDPAPTPPAESAEPRPASPPSAF